MLFQLFLQYIWECSSERIIKIGQHLSEKWWKCEADVFMEHPVHIYTCVYVYRVFKSYTHVYNFWKTGPLKFGRTKKRPKFSSIFDNFRIWSRISPELLQISKIWNKCDRQRFVPRSIKKSGELWSTNKKFYWLTLSHPCGFFGEDYISAPRGCCALKFSDTLEIDKGL